FFQAEDGIRYRNVTGVQTCALPICVDLQLTKTGELAPVRYAQLARALNVELGDSAPLEHIRQTVLDLRASKGMVLESTDYDTWRSEEHTSELQSRFDIVCRLLLEKK